MTHVTTRGREPGRTERRHIAHSGSLRGPPTTESTSMNLHPTPMARRLAPAVLGALLVLTAACGSSADDEPTPPAGAACPVGTPDCNDADLGQSPDEPPPAGETCLVGTTDCNDADLGDPGTAGEPDGDEPAPTAGMCAPGVTDCDDTGILDDPSGAAGGAAGGTCLVGTTDCNDADLGGESELDG